MLRDWFSLRDGVINYAQGWQYGELSGISICRDLW